ncbi:MAG: AI-2E family transporter [Planctomycetes bacterium]|nr:AI-2E family transporter [Planctomycetota bacterium]
MGIAHEPKEENNRLITASLAVLAVVALAVVLIYTRAVMIPFVVALFIVALVAPIQDFQVKRLRLPRIIAVIITLLVVFSIIALASLSVAQAIRTIAYTAGEYSTSFANMADKFLKPLEYLYRLEERPPAALEAEKAKPPAEPNEVKPVPSKPEAFELFPLVNEPDKAAVLDVRPKRSSPSPLKGIDLSTVPYRSAPPTSEALPKGVGEPAAPAARSDPRASAQGSQEAAAAPAEPNQPAKDQRRIDTRKIIEDLIANAKQIIRDLANHMFNMLRNTVGTIFGLLSGMLFVCFFVIFLLAGRNPYAEHSQMYRDVVVNIRRYLGTKVLTSAAVGVLVWASLAIIGMELAGVFGVLAFLLNFIPVIGPVIVTVLPIPLALAQFQSHWPVILVVVVPGVIHNAIGNIIEPKLMGKGLDLHPVTIMLALSVWGLLWGIVGMFLAAPITAAIRIVLMQFDTFRPIANLLAGEFEKPPTGQRQEGPAVTRVAAPPSKAESAGSLR